MPGCIPFDRTSRSGALGTAVGTGSRARSAVLRRRLAQHRRPSAEESSADVAARLETEIANLLSAVHTVQGGSQNGSVKLPGGLWIITERAVATESGEPVDPVQAALWGFGRTTINEEPALRCKLVDCDGSQEAVQRTGQPARHTGSTSRNSRCGKESCWPRGCCHGRAAVISRCRARADYVLAPTERGAIDNLRLTETDVPPPDEGYVQVRVEAAGLNFRDVLNVLGLYPGDPGPIGGDFAGIVTQLGSGVTGLEVGQRVYGFMQGAFSSRFNVPAQLLAPMPGRGERGRGGHHSRCGADGPTRVRLGAAAAR